MIPTDFFMSHSKYHHNEYIDSKYSIIKLLVMARIVKSDYQYGIKYCPKHHYPVRHP